MNNRLIGIIAWWLLIIGGLNWGLIGLMNLNVVSAIFGMSFIARLVYILVGLSAAYVLYEKYSVKKV